MKKKVLLMGGSYFIGKKIVDLLIESEYEVSILNRGTKPNNDSRIKLIQCDRNNADLMSEKLLDEVFDIVIDVSGVKRKELEILYHSINISKVEQFIFISSSAVYDIDRIRPPFHESSERRENSHWTFYGQSKIETEDYLIDRFINTPTKLTILRPPYMYGENNYAQRESFIFDHIVNNKKIIIPNLGETRLQFLYTGDLGNIILKLLCTNQENINIYNVGNVKSVTVNEWISACERIAGKKSERVYFNYKDYNRNVREFFPFFDYDNVLDVSKIKQIVQEETELEVGLKLAYHWYLANKEVISFKENIAHFEEQILSILE